MAVSDGQGLSPTGPTAQANRQEMVKRLLADAASAVDGRDAELFQLRRSQVESILPRLTSSFAKQVTYRLSALAARLTPAYRTKPAKAPVSREKAMSRLRWFVLDVDDLIHREMPGATGQALCGRVLVQRVWEGSVGRNDRRWCRGCEQKAARLKSVGSTVRPKSAKPTQRVRAKPVTVVQAPKGAFIPGAHGTLAQARTRNATMRKALEADQPTAQAERRWRVSRLLAGSPGLGKRS